MITIPDLKAEFAKLTLLRGRTPQMAEVERKGSGAFATLAPFRDGNTFSAKFAGDGAWERHPNGDELVQIIDGSAALHVMTEDGPRSHAVSAGMMVIVPQGTWHRFHSPEGVSLMTATPKPTEHLTVDVEDPRTLTAAQRSNTIEESGAEFVSTAALSPAHPHRGRLTMPNEIRRVDYFYIAVPDRPGEGARALGALRDAGVNLLAYSGFPEGRGAQLDFVPEDAAAFRRVAKDAKWKLAGPKKAFLITGDDRPGAIAEIVQKLADAKINVTACDAVAQGGGRYGAILWVAPRDVGRAAKALGAS